MPDNKDFVLNSVNQYRHFDFDSTILANKGSYLMIFLNLLQHFLVFNAFTVKWNDVVKKLLIPEIVELTDGKLTKESKNKLEEICLNRLFQRGKINLILDRFKVCFVSNFKLLNF